VDNITMDHIEIGWDGVDWIDLTQGPAEGSRECGNELSASIKFWEVHEWLHNRWPLE
jgi:hypothetical protein